MNGIIYKATNKKNNKTYIGQTTKSLEKRRKNHKNSANSKKNQYFLRAIKKYGINNFDWEIICKVEAKTKTLLLFYLDIAEQTWVAKFNTVNPKFGYNLTEGGRNGKRSSSTKKKMSKAQLGTIFSEEHKRKLSECHADVSGENNPMYGTSRISKAAPMYGKHHSEETKANMSKSHIGKIATEEAKANMSKAKTKEKHPMYGKHHREETKEKISKANSGENHYMYGKRCSEETKKKMSESSKGGKNSMYGMTGEKNPMFGKKGSNSGKFGENSSGWKGDKAGKRALQKRKEKALKNILKEGLNESLAAL